MTWTNGLERELATWLTATATPSTPDYTDDILRRVARVRQRPRWAFLERWLPMSVTVLQPVRSRPLPWRTIALLALLSLLLLGAVALYAGSRPRVPAPFGLAGNGLVAYARDGDIYTVDPVSGARRAIVTGLDQDEQPRWSLDGSRLAFLRPAGGLSMRLVIVDADGGNPIVTAKAFRDYDTDSIAWAPDGQSVALAAVGPAGGRSIRIVDAATGDVTTLTSGYTGFEFFWRPPDGRQLLFSGRGASGPGLLLYSLDSGAVEELPVIADPAQPELRPVGWTPDGRHYAYQRHLDGVENWTRVVDIETGAAVDLPVAYGHLSNDGTRVAGLDSDGERWPCVASVNGGPCGLIGGSTQAPEGTHRQGLHWSPDDRWIITLPASGDMPALLDPRGARVDQPAWLAEGAHSWQRVP